jgi:hypothetical protein
MVDDISRGIATTIKFVLLLIICVGFLGIGMVKLVSHPGIIDQFKYWSFPIWTMYLIGFIEVILSVVVFYKPTRERGLIGIIMLMCGAGLVHIIHQQWSYVYVPIILIALCVGILYLDRLSAFWDAEAKD